MLRSCFPLRFSARKSCRISSVSVGSLERLNPSPGGGPATLSPPPQERRAVHRGGAGRRARGQGEAPDRGARGRGGRAELGGDDRMKSPRAGQPATDPDCSETTPCFRARFEEQGPRPSSSAPTVQSPSRTPPAALLRVPRTKTMCRPSATRRGRVEAAWMTPRYAPELIVRYYLNVCNHGSTPAVIDEFSRWPRYFIGHCAERVTGSVENRTGLGSWDELRLKTPAVAGRGLRVGGATSACLAGSRPAPGGACHRRRRSTGRAPPVPQLARSCACHRRGGTRPRSPDCALRVSLRP